MGLDSLVSKYAGQTLTVQAYSGFDAYGSPIWATPTAASTYACLIIPKVQSVRGRTGVEEVSSVQIYLSGNTTVAIEDKITLPDGSQPLVMAVQKYPNFTGSTDILTVVYT